MSLKIPLLAVTSFVAGNSATSTSGDEESVTAPAEKASLVLPAYNERGRIEACLRAVAEWRRSRPGGWDWEVLLVDDGSSDGTRAAAARIAAEANLPLTVLAHDPRLGAQR